MTTYEQYKRDSRRWQKLIDFVGTPSRTLETIRTADDVSIRLTRRDDGTIELDTFTI